MILLPVGGDKDSQRRNIAKAEKMEAALDWRRPTEPRAGRGGPVTMTIKITRFDATKYLEPDDYVELLNEALAIGDPRLIIHVLNETARGRGMSDLARVTGIGRSSLYKALADDANPTIDTLMKVLDGLKLELRAQPAGTAQAQEPEAEHA